MPILANAKKALRVSRRKAVNNRARKSRVKTSIDTVKRSPSQGVLSTAFSEIDRAVKRHLLHRKKAARIKSRLSGVLARQTAATKPSETKPQSDVKTSVKSAKTSKSTAKAKTVSPTAKKSV